jgi:hypothetical protein
MLTHGKALMTKSTRSFTIRLDTLAAQLHQTRTLGAHLLNTTLHLTD